ncbi:MAG TPA: acyl-CoA dehydrogenase C-terminal domain-containing protein, partial [Polyangiales bacterium]
KEWEQLTQGIAQRSQKDPEEAAASAFDYLLYSGYVTLAYLWARMSRVAKANLGKSSAEDPFYRSKLQTARFYYERILPRTRALAATLKAPAATLMDVAEDAFVF